MMTDTLKKMNDMLSYESRLGAQVYYVRLERPLCLMMEDLASLGFRMADRQAGFDLEHSLMAIRGLARFHATSVALCEKVKFFSPRNSVCRIDLFYLQQVDRPFKRFVYYRRNQSTKLCTTRGCSTGIFQTSLLASSQAFL